MTEMAPERHIERTCAVCSTPLPLEPTRRGRPRKVCRDEDSPTPGGCRQFRLTEQKGQRNASLPDRPGVHRQPRGLNPWHVWPEGGFIIVRVNGDGERRITST